MSAAVFVPRTLEELELERLLEAFPADKFEGRSMGLEAGPYISPAQVKTALRCLETYRRRYVRGEKTRPAAALIWGSADHAAHEANFAQKIHTRTDLALADVEFRFAEELDKRVDEDGGAGEIEWENGVVHTGDDARAKHAWVKDNGVALVGMYHREVSPAVDPLVVEDRFSIDVAGVPVPIRGARDLVANVPVVPGSEERERRVIDRKTAGRRAISPEWRTQGRMYQLVEEIPLEFHLSLKPGKQRKHPGVSAFEFVEQAPPAAQTIALIQRVVAMVTSMYETYGPDEPWPGTALGGFGDTCGYCGFKPSCPWWAWNGGRNGNT